MVALVIEGGAARAAYASGAALALQEAGFVPDAIYGTSAGGAIGAWFAAGQAHLGIRTWDAIADRRLLSYRRALWGDRPVIDFRLLYSEYYPRVFGLDLDALRRAPYPVCVTVTDADTGKALYPDLRSARDPLALLHATSALPLVSECPVEVEGRRLVDGGATAPVPLARALEDGHKDVVVLANRPRGARKPESRLTVALVARQFPSLRDATERHHEIHDAAMRLAESPPAGVRVRLVRPSRDLGVGRFTRDVAKLRAAIEEGRRDGARVAAGMRAAR